MVAGVGYRDRVGGHGWGGLWQVKFVIIALVQSANWKTLDCK